MSKQATSGAKGVVPLHPAAGERSEVYGSAWNADEAAAAAGQRQPPPQLTYRGGPLIANVEPFVVWWGRGWSTQMDLVAQLESFWQWIVAGPLLEQVAEYSVPGRAQIGPGRYAGALLLPDEPPSPLHDSQIRAMLLEGLERGSLPAPDANTLYVVYTDSGVQVQQNGDASCTTFCGYHDCISPGADPRTAQAVYYAAVPYPGCAGCTGPMQVFDALCVTSSHELAEAITDPVPGQGWYDDTYGEIADMCAWQTRRVGPYSLQREWSNASGACV